MVSKIEKRKKLKKAAKPHKKSPTVVAGKNSHSAGEDLSNEQLHVIIKKLNTELEQTKMQLDQFAHTSSHELQEPLRKIITFSRFLQNKKLKHKSATIKIYLDKIEAASVRMTKLIQDMLKFTLITNYEKLFVETDLNEVLTNVMFDLELLIDEKKVKIIAHKLPRIEAVPFQMNQLFYDIVHNAIKFSKPDVPPVLKISTHKLTPSEIASHPDLGKKLKYYEITFEDNGIGFDQKYAKQIFTMFQRLSAGGNYAGTGIGLAICQKIVQSCYGTIFAEGIEGKGATIHVILPEHQPKKLPEDISTILKTWV